MKTTVEIELVTVICWCGMPHGVPENLRNQQLKNHHDGKGSISIYCPLGHSHVPSGEARSVQLERDLQRERQRLDQEKARAKDLTNQLNAEKAAKSRIKNRVANGVCPCCNRSFQNLRRHMTTKHPEFSGSNA